MQATFEKLFTHLYVAMSGAQYIIHYAFGLLNRTNTFCPLQAVMDNEHIGMIKECLRQPKVGPAVVEDVSKLVRKVMSSPHRLYARHIRKALHAGEVSKPYRFETTGLDDRVLEKALEHMEKLEAEPAPHLDSATVNRIYREVPRLLPELRKVSQ
jgi:trimethylamine--corrinoid protein Co-methyltransferase